MTDRNDPVEQTIKDIKDGELSSGLAIYFGEFADKHPEHIERLIARAMEECDKLRLKSKWRYMFNSVFRYATKENIRRLLPIAIRFLDTDETNIVAEEFLRFVCYSHPSLVRTHLKETFRLRVSDSDHYQLKVWRGTGKTFFPFFSATLEDPTQPMEDRWKAWCCLIGTQDREVIRYAIKQFSMLGLDGDPNLYLAANGFCIEDGDLKQLYPDREFHLFFDKKYFDGPLQRWKSSPNLASYELKLNRLTWRSETEDVNFNFGGVSSNACSLCNGKLHHLITLKPMIDGIGVTGLDRLELSTCLSCLGWEEQNLFYNHDETGDPQSLSRRNDFINPQFPAQPLLTTTVRLSELPDAWRDDTEAREWESYRIGADPWWVQSAEYPVCPRCQRKMLFLMQLASSLPTIEGEEWWWGSGGVGYIFWCDECRVSGYLWQCT